VLRQTPVEHDFAARAVGIVLDGAQIS